MSFLIICPHRDPGPWIKALKARDPSLEIEVFPEVKDPEKVEFALSWHHPQGIFTRYPNLQVIASMGAGIDHIVKDLTIAPHIRITRIVDQQLATDMATFVLATTLQELRNLSFHHCSQEWQPRSYRRPQDVRVGIMGMGVLGKAVAETLSLNGFQVQGWKKGKTVTGTLPVYSGKEQLATFLSTSNFLVCLLPLTSETRNILNRALFEKLPPGAYLINVARGHHLVEEDLVAMIEQGHLSGASLDVFRQEPLPKEHVFWKHDRIRVTPHIASVTHPESVVPQILENYRNRKEEALLNHRISRKKEY